MQNAVAVQRHVASAWHLLAHAYSADTDLLAQQVSRCKAGTARYRNSAPDDGNRPSRSDKIAVQALMLM